MADLPARPRHPKRNGEEPLTNMSGPCMNLGSNTEGSLRQHPGHHLAEEASRESARTTFNKLMSVCTPWPRAAEIERIEEEEDRRLLTGLTCLKMLGRRHL
ncbi:uncharacterized protein [Branchiostoma lanceolatum]|uniref:uncharacterized protein n=1 Tax=Branchiostoma lanceolatum TaxID=7740 RepID=UPI0034546ED6